jgi:hypothetical protein
VPLIWGATVHAQEIKNPAEVLPKETLAYAELQQPGQVAMEIAALLEGSVLGNLPDSFAKYQGKYSPAQRGPRPTDIAPFGLMTAPEVVGELNRIRGAAIAITGIDPEDKNQPEFVAFVMPGESNFPGFIYRMFMASYGYGYTNYGNNEINEYGSRVDPIGECEGVRLYRPVSRRATYVRGPNGQRGEQKGQPVIKPEGPAVARLSSGTILIGTPDRLKDVIRRAKGQSSDSSLASVRAFQEASKQLGNRPGVFVYGNPATILNVAEQFVPPAIKEPYSTVKKLVNPAALAGIAGRVAVEDGSLNIRWLARLDPGEKSPVLDILPTKPLSTDLLNYAPKDALFVAALSNTDGEQRWERFVHAADEAAKAVMPPKIMIIPPSRMIAAAEGGLGMKIGKDVLGKIETVGIAMPSAQRIDAEKGSATFIPVVALIRATDDDAATRFAKEFIPSIVGTATFQYGIQPTEKKVGDQIVYEFSFGKDGPTLSYGRNGATLILGMNSALVAESLSAGAKKEGFTSGNSAAGALKRAGEPVFLVATKPLTIAGTALAVRRTVVHRTDASGKVATTVTELPPDPETAALLKLAAEEEPLVISLSRQPDHMAWEASYPGLKRLVPKVIDLAIEAQFEPPPSPRHTSPEPADRPAAKSIPRR